MMKWALEVVLLEFLEAFFTLIPQKVQFDFSFSSLNVPHCGVWI